jgi:outer membrane lipoprotein SlyB
MRMKAGSIIALCFLALPLGACVNKSVNDVALGDAGQAYTVKFGTVIEAHKVNIRTDPKTGVGAGALVGTGAGYAAHQDAGTVLAGALAGAIAGAVVQNIAESNNGVEYTIAFADGSVQVIDQVQDDKDQVFEPGSAVMVQFGATRNRVLSAANLPKEISAPKGVKVAGAPKGGPKIKVETCQKSGIGEAVRKTCTQE